jgi:hypothetical protein
LQSEQKLGGGLDSLVVLGYFWESSELNEDSSGLIGISAGLIEGS